MILHSNGVEATLMTIDILSSTAQWCTNCAILDCERRAGFQYSIHDDKRQMPACYRMPQMNFYLVIGKMPLNLAALVSPIGL
jgi:hypothetical protein